MQCLLITSLQYIDHSESRNLTGFSVSRPAGTYYFDNDGCMQTGLVRCEDGNLRYFDPKTGVMVTNQWYNDYEAIWYYFGADGTAVSGWQFIGGDGTTSIPKTMKWHTAEFRLMAKTTS